MPRTQLTGSAILDGSIKAEDLDVTIPLFEIPVDYNYTVFKQLGRVIREEWKNSDNTLFLKKVEYTRVNGKVVSYLTTKYDYNGVAVETLNTIITRSNGKVVSMVGDYTYL